MVEALGRAPQTPEEALGVLGALLRSNPAEKGEFVRQAHLAWVGGGWAVKGDPSPEARVVLMALVEATRRLAERYGWKRGGGAPRLRVTEEVAQRVKVGEVGARGSNVFRVGPNGLSQKALWRAAYLVAQGEEVVLTGPLAAKAKRLILAKAAKVLARSRNTVRMPWGEEVPLLRGDRWEDLSLPEPRIAAALRELQELLEERRQEEEVEVEEVREPWAHQVQVSPVALKRLWGEVDPESRQVEAVYLRDQLEVLDLLDGVEVDVYHAEELHRVLGIAPGFRPRRPEAWRRMLEGIARYGRPFTYGEIREVFEKKGKKRDWMLYRLLQAPVAWEVETLGFKDPEAAFQEGILKGLLIGRRWRLGEVNPMVYLLAEIRKHLLELRAKEVGVFHLPWEKARAVRRYFALVHKHGFSSEEAAKRAGLPPELREALSGKELSVEAFLEVGVDPTGEEVDYDTFLLKRKVEELRVEVRELWGAPGEEFLELLLDGVAPYAAAYQLGLGAEFAEEVVAYLRNGLEPWVD